MTKTSMIEDFIPQIDDSTFEVHIAK